MHIHEKPEQATAEGAAWYAFSRVNPDTATQLTLMGLNDPEKTVIDTSEYPALMVFPNEKFSNNFFKIQR